MRFAHTPRLRFRPTTPADFPECVELLPEWLNLGEPLRRALPDLWSRIHNEPPVRTTIMEDLALPVGQRIQGWGCGFVLPDEWVERETLDGSPAAYLGRRLYADLHAGRFRLLADAQIGVLNAQGRIRFFNFYIQRQTDLQDPYVQSVFNIANEAFRFSASGYKYQAMYFETSLHEVPAIVAAGFRRRPYSNEQSLEHLPAHARPAFLSVTREESLAILPGTTIRHVFEHHPPLFQLSASQRQLLWLAMFDESDAYLTARLDVSVHGLKKLWRGIYERIEDRMPEFFGDTVGADDGRRGPEKRRQVLAYLRQRPEELRPWVVERE